MTIKESFRGALRRLAGARVPDQRWTLALPSMLVPYGSRIEVMPKPTPANLRRFAETPIARKAINTVKDRIAGMKWRIQPKNGRALAELPQGAERVAILTDNLDAPNSDDSFRSLAEQVLEDVIVGGFGAIELQLSRNPARPLLLYPVDGAAIASDMRAILELHDIDPASPGSFSAASTVLYDNVISAVPGYCTYALVNALSAQCSIAFTRISRVLETEVRSQIPSQSTKTRLVGSILFAVSLLSQPLSTASRR